MKLAAIRNITLILGLSLPGEDTDSTGKVIYTKYLSLGIRQLNVFYLNKYVNNFRFVSLNGKKDWYAVYKRGICDLATGIFEIKDTSNSILKPNLSFTNIITQPCCVAVHSVPRPNEKSVNILWFLGIASKHFVNMIVILIFSLLLIFSFLAVKNSQLTLISQLSFVGEKVLANFTGISLTKAMKSPKSLINIIIASLVIFLLTLQMLFAAKFTTDMTIAEKGPELERIEMLDTWNLKMFSMIGLCNMELPSSLQDRISFLKKQGVVQELTRSTFAEFIGNDPGTVVFIYNRQEWYASEAEYYNIRGYNAKLEYVRKNYLYRSQSIPGSWYVFSYNNVRVKKDKLKLVLDWSQGLLEMGLYNAAMQRYNLELSSYYSYTPSDRYKNILYETDIKSVNLNFIQPSFIILMALIGVSGSVLILENFYHAYSSIFVPYQLFKNC